MERIKQAIDKARKQRKETGTGSGEPERVAPESVVAAIDEAGITYTQTKTFDVTKHIC